MSIETAYLALLLDGPLQSWGFASRFDRRATGPHPTKSGVAGLICAAMGLPKGSQVERDVLPDLAALRMTSIAVPRPQSRLPAVPLSVSHLEDYHTVLGTRRADGHRNDNAVETRRQYLLDARFGVIVRGERSGLERIAAALGDPVWGVWLGRKCCIPASPILVGLHHSEESAWKAILAKCGLKDDLTMAACITVTEVERFVEGSDSINDQPISFGDGASSGPDKRRFGTRRVAVRAGLPQP